MSGEHTHLVLSALGTDRPGIVDAVSQFILDRGGNIEASRMAVLGGEFTLMVLVSAPESAAAAIEGEIGALAEGLDLRTLVKRTSPPSNGRNQKLPSVVEPSGMAPAWRRRGDPRRVPGYARSAREPRRFRSRRQR